MLRAILLLGLATAAPLHAADIERGRMLYESGCTACHSRSVHLRQARRAPDYPAIRAQVERWGREAGVPWTRDDLDDVTFFLNDRYYRFNCRDGKCGPGPAASRAAGVPVAGATQH
jgi:hypothetical protein